MNILIESLIQNILPLAASIATIAGAIYAYKSYKKNHSSTQTQNDPNQDNDSLVLSDSMKGETNIIISGGGTVNLNEQKTNKNKENTKPNNITTEIQLQSIYTSLFAEDNKLKTEKIIISKQEQGNIEGTVELIEKDISGKTNKTFTYFLKGIFKNKILTGEYYSQADINDERGAINLKLIDPDILSGFCSFSKMSSNTDDEIRVSPYIWVAGKNKDLLDGTYEFCTNCYKEKVSCCCASDNIDMPIFLDTEKTFIQSKLKGKKKEIHSFSEDLPAPFNKTKIRQIKREKLTTPNANTQSKCCFFNINTNICGIYEQRPIDCRLFPFDIKLSPTKGEYVIGYYTTLCERELPYDSMKKYAHILRPYFFLLYPYLHVFTSDSVCERLNNADFQEIGTFKDFIF